MLRRVLELDAPDASAQAANEIHGDRMRAGDLLDRKVYDLRILEVIDGLGGSGYASDVVDAVGKLVEDQLTASDWLKNKSAVVRWRNRVAWRRFNLVQMGLLKRGSPRGMWEISEEGRQPLHAGAITYPDS